MPSDRPDATPSDVDVASIVLAGHAGDRSTAVRALDHPDGGMRAAALGALERMGDLDASRLRTALGDADATVRRRAAELAAQHDDVDLSVALDDADAGVVEVAAWACGEQASVSTEVLDRLIRLATDADDALVRESAAAALGAIGDPRGLSAVLAACTDRPAVRRRAVLALAAFLEVRADENGHGHDHGHQHAHQHDPVRAAIEAALTDRDWQVRQAAEDLIRAERGATW